MTQAFNDRTPLQRLLWLGGMAKAAGGKGAEETASGNPVVFTTDLARPLKRLALSLLPRQSGTGDPSPENIRPLLPWGEVGTWHGGKNLLNTQVGNDLAYRTFNKYTIENGNIIVTGATLMGFKFKCKPETRYAFSFNRTYKNATMRVYGYAEEPTSYEIGDALVDIDKVASASFVTGANHNWLICGFYANTDDAVFSDFQLEVGETATAFVPYSPITPHPVDLTGITPPVYGCELDLTTGEVWQTYYLASFRKSDFGDVMHGTAMDYRQTPFNSLPTSASGVDWNNARKEQKFNRGVIANPWGETAYGTDVGIVVEQGGSMGTYMRISESVYQAMSDDDYATISYKLATPVLLATLTAQQVNALVGVNTVWSDADGIELTYMKKG